MPAPPQPPAPVSPEGAPPPTAVGTGRVQRRILTALAGLGVTVLAGIGYTVTYTDLKALALQGHASRHLAPVYPVMLDALITITVLALILASGSRWWSRWPRWLLFLILVTGAGAASVDRAVSSYARLPQQWVKAGVAVAPHLMLLIAVWLWLGMFRHARAALSRPAPAGSPADLVPGFTEPPAGQAAPYAPADDLEYVPADEATYEPYGGHPEEPGHPYPEPGEYAEDGPAGPAYGSGAVPAGPAYAEEPGGDPRDEDPYGGDGRAAVADYVADFVRESRARQEVPGEHAEPGEQADGPEGSWEPLSGARAAAGEEPAVPTPPAFLPTDVRLVGRPDEPAKTTQPDLVIPPEALAGVADGEPEDDAPRPPDGTAHPEPGGAAEPHREPPSGSFRSGPTPPEES